MVENLIVFISGNGTNLQAIIDGIVNGILQNMEISLVISNRKTAHGLKRAKKAGMLVHTYWILGYPGETYEEIQKTVEFAYNSGADSFSFSNLQPLPGTPIYRKVMKENFTHIFQIDSDGQCNPRYFQKLFK